MFRKKRIFLDFAAGALPNPSSPHAEGREAKRVLEDARTRVARTLEVQVDDVVFTSGATEANALAILGLAKPGAHFLYLPSAHASMVENMKLAAERFGVVAEPLPVKDARVDICTLETMIRGETALISMDAVCGETGVVWNTREVKACLEKARAGQAGARALLHVDASQAVCTEKLQRAHFGADLMTFDGGKLGVRGVGALIAHRTIPLAPLYEGGGQERELRSGTENVEAIAHFSVRLMHAAEERDAFRAAAEQLRGNLLACLARIPSIHINEGRTQAPHILNLSIPGRDTDYVVALLDESGIAASTKSACETDSAEGSRAVLALTGDPERAKATLRISFGPATHARELVRFADELARILASGLA